VSRAEDLVTNTPQDAARFEHMYGDDSDHDSRPDFEGPDEPDPWLAAVIEDGPQDE
jgi:hypothetical protein